MCAVNDSGISMNAFIGYLILPIQTHAPDITSLCGLIFCYLFVDALIHLIKVLDRMNGLNRTVSMHYNKPALKQYTCTRYDYCNRDSLSH